MKSISPKNIRKLIACGNEDFSLDIEVSGTKAVELESRLTAEMKDRQ
jgi:hypothetical protein